MYSINLYKVSPAKLFLILGNMAIKKAHPSGKAFQMYMLITFQVL